MMMVMGQIMLQTHALTRVTRLLFVQTISFYSYKPMECKMSIKNCDIWMLALNVSIEKAVSKT